MALTPGPQRALGSRGQTINAEAWPYFDGLIRAVMARCPGVSYDDLVVEATRTKARQAYLYANRNRPGFNPAYPPDSNLAYHVAGDAVDFGARAGTRGSPVQIALHQLGAAFGIFFEVKDELWHGRFDRRRAPKITWASASNAKEVDFMPTATEIVQALLNYPAYTPAPGENVRTVSQVLKSLDQGLWKGGDSTGPKKLPLATQIAEIFIAATDTVHRGETPVTQIQDNADTGTIVRRLETKLDQIVPKSTPTTPTTKK